MCSFEKHGLQRSEEGAECTEKDAASRAGRLGEGGEDESERHDEGAGGDGEGRGGETEEDPREEAAEGEREASCDLLRRRLLARSAKEGKGELDERRTRDQGSGGRWC